MAEVLIFDFETLSNRPRDAAIVSLGAIACNWDDVGPEKAEELFASAFYSAFKPKRQVQEYGASISPSTIDWWKKQSPEAQAVLTDPNAVDIEKLPELFGQYCSEKGVNKKTTVLIRAPHFDFTIIDFHYENLKAELPFNHWKIRDVRSIIDACCGTDDGYVPGFKDYMSSIKIVAHNAASDCVKDLLQVKMAMTQDFSAIQTFNEVPWV